MEKIVRLDEGDLRRIVSEAVGAVMGEGGSFDGEGFYSMWEKADAFSKSNVHPLRGRYAELFSQYRGGQADGATVRELIDVSSKLISAMAQAQNMYGEALDMARDHAMGME